MLNGLFGCLYKLISAGIWLIVFVGAWTYCTGEYGFLLGFGLGWLPAGILATICATVWPLVAIVGVLIYLTAN